MNTTSSAATSLDDEAPIIVFLIGGPGSGKTTQAEALAGDDDSKSVRVSPGVVRLLLKRSYSCDLSIYINESHTSLFFTIVRDRGRKRDFLRNVPYFRSLRLSFSRNHHIVNCVNSSKKV